MFTPEDRKKGDAILEKAHQIGEEIGIFIHNNGKNIIKSIIFMGCAIIVGGVCLLLTAVKKTVKGR
jgi:hypothetical protein